MSGSTLKRSLSLPVLTLYGLGTILGAGIYVLVGKVALVAGLFAPISFLVASVLAMFTAYSFALLSAQYPKAAGPAYYVEQAFARQWLSRIVGWLVIATGVVSAATIARGFVGYLEVYWTLPSWLVITILVLLLVVIASWGVAESVGLAAVITVVELSGLLLVVYFASDALWMLPQQLPTLVPSFDISIWFTILLGGFLAFYAFIGFEDMVNVAEEVIEPARNMPIAILIAMVVAGVLYIVIALIAVLALPLAELQQTDAPMVDLLKPYNADAASVVALISLVAVTNGALVQLIMGARVVYGMAQQGLMPKWFANIAPKTQTPVRATVLIGLIILILALAFPLLALAKFTSFIVVLVFALVNYAQVTLQLKSTVWTQQIQRWLIPAVGGVLSLCFLGVQIYASQSGQLIVGH